VLLVRHGQSEWNAAGRWQGQADPPLTSLGRRQAFDAARALGTIDAIFASTLQRALQTALIISESLGVGPVVADADLVERDAGEWSGLTRAEIEERYPGYLGSGTDEHKGFAGGALLRPPGWEDDGSVLARARAALARIHDAVGGGDVLAVTHGGLIYVLEQELSGTFVRLANAEGRWFTVSDGGGLALGDRVLLVPPDEVTVPKAI
jgi:probable phosphoglycerate mutase